MFEQWVWDILEPALKKVSERPSLEVPPDSSLGDYAFPCFLLARQLKKNPAIIAQEFASQLKPNEFVHKISAQGGYVNFFLHQSAIAKYTLTQIFEEKEKYGTKKQTKQNTKTYLAEFFDANTHKGVYIGHLRALSLGCAVSNLLESQGHNVKRVNYQGDIGPHVAKCIWGYLRFKEKPPQKHKGIWLGELYARASTLVKEHPEFEEEIKQLNIKIYQHDASVEKIWQQTRQWCLDDFDEFYNEWGVKYDRLFFESETESIGKKEFEKLLQKGIAQRSDGAIIMDLKEYGLDVYVALTSQGNSTYYAKELGLASLKIKKFGSVDTSLHFVGSEQQLFFKQMFKTLELMNSPLAGKSVHIQNGLVMLPEGKMSSRLGTMVLYHNLYTELMRLATIAITERHDGLSEKEIVQRAKSITFGALKYSMLDRQNHKNIVFDWEKALEFEGDTGPYIQYAHARCASILRKAKNDGHATQKLNTKVHYESLSTSYESHVIKQLASFGDVVSNAALEYRPHLVTHYLLNLAQTFTEFYHNCPVISDLTEVMHARLLLVLCVKQVLHNGLALLGIPAPEEM